MATWAKVGAAVAEIDPISNVSSFRRSARRVDAGTLDPDADKTGTRKAPRVVAFDRGAGHRCPGVPVHTS
jgi:hypothetical protein